MPTKYLFTRVPDELHARVKARSARTGVPMSKIVIDALNTYLESFHVVCHVEDYASNQVHLYFDKGDLERTARFEDERIQDR